MFLLISFGLILCYIGLFYLKNHSKYEEELLRKTNLTIEGLSAPRGRILDKNGIVLVDNIAINNLVFHYVKGIDLVEVAKKLSEYFTFANPSDKELINWYKANNNIYSLLTEEEKRLIEERKVDKDEIIEEKILELVLSFSDKDKNTAKAYALLNDGYLYSPKIIIKKISDEEIANIINDLPKGITIETSFERYYPYKEVLKGILGKVGNITKDNKETYLKEGYSLNDEVGISYLEKYYDSYLKGKKALYFVNDDYSLDMISDYEKGNDVYLSIDINLQLKVEEIIEKNLIKAKSYPNTEYLTDSYVIMSNPKTGEINAIAGKRLLKEDEFHDIVINNISSSFTMGSAVKGATITVGYQNDLIDPNKKIYDSCVKLLNQTEKCSHMELGYLDAVTALEHSSNYYQFLIAIGLAGQTYTPNMNLTVSKREFDIYRSTLESYGLGIKTGIDLPNEKIGLIGQTISPDLLLNLSIGQYDTYTPIELLTYINTLADYGQRRKPSLVSKIMDNKDTVVYQNKYEVVDTVNISKEDMDYIHEGFYYVMNRGTGRGFMNYKLSPAGKTGTSESFMDFDNDGKIDTQTLTLTMTGYFPSEDPQYSLIVISPHTSHNNGSKGYIYYITSRISREITDFMFENIEIP